MVVAVMVVEVNGSSRLESGAILILSSDDHRLIVVHAFAEKFVI